MIDSTRDSREEQIPNFIKWFMQHGGLAEKVTIARFDGQGLGLKALADIKVSVQLPKYDMDCVASCTVPLNFGLDMW